MWMLKIACHFWDLSRMLHARMRIFECKRLMNTFRPSCARCFFRWYPELPRSLHSPSPSPSLFCIRHVTALGPTPGKQIIPRSTIVRRFFQQDYSFPITLRKFEEDVNLTFV